MNLNLCDIDSAYTEKLMGLPNITDNYKGYEEADLSKYVSNLKDKQFLLVGDILPPLSTIN